MPTLGAKAILKEILLLLLELFFGYFTTGVALLQDVQGGAILPILVEDAALGLLIEERDDLLSHVLGRVPSDHGDAQEFRDVLALAVGTGVREQRGDRAARQTAMGRRVGQMRKVETCRFARSSHAPSPEAPVPAGRRLR